MRRLGFAVLACLSAVAIIAAPLLADAETVAVSQYDDSKLNVELWDSESVASGAAVAMTTFDTRRFRSVACEVRTSNEAGGASRLYIPKCMLSKSSSTVQYTYDTHTLTTNSTGRMVFGEGAMVFDPDSADSLSAVTAQTNGLPQNTTYYPGPLCPYLKITAAAANGITEALCTLKSK